MPDYSPWIKKQVQSGADVLDLNSDIEYFEKHKNLFEIKELEKFHHQSLKIAIKDVNQSRIDRHTKGLSEKDFKFIFEDEEYFIVRANNRKAALSFSKNTKWCLNSKSDYHFQENSSQGFVFYFIIRKFRKNNELDKIAVTVNYNDYVYYNQKDKEIVSTLYIDSIFDDFDSIKHENINIYVDCFYNYEKYLNSKNTFLKNIAIKKLSREKIIEYINDESEIIRLTVAKKINKKDLPLLIKDPSDKVRAYVASKIDKSYLKEFINDPNPLTRSDLCLRLPKDQLPLMLGDSDSLVIYNLCKRIDKKYLPELATHKYEFTRLMVARRLPTSDLLLFLGDTSEVVASAISKRLTKQQRKIVKEKGSSIMKYYVDLVESGYAAPIPCKGK